MKKWHEYYKPWSMADYYKHIKAWKGFCHRIARFTPKSEPILEVGYGTGQMSIYLAQSGYSVFGIDKESELKRRALKLASELELDKKLKTWPHFMIGNLFKLPKDEEQYKRFWKGQFHTVFSQGLLEHFGDEKIKEAFRIQFDLGKVVAFSIPLDKFGHQSRGDERLLSEDHWRDLIDEYKILYWETFAKGTQLMGILRND